MAGLVLTCQSCSAQGSLCVEQTSSLGGSERQITHPAEMKWEIEETNRVGRRHSGGGKRRCRAPGDNQLHAVLVCGNHGSGRTSLPCCVAVDGVCAPLTIPRVK